MASTILYETFHFQNLITAKFSQLRVIRFLGPPVVRSWRSFFGDFSLSRPTVQGSLGSRQRCRSSTSGHISTRKQLLKLNTSLEQHHTKRGTGNAELINYMLAWHTLNKC